VPRDLLVALHNGAVLHERGYSWSSSTLQTSGEAPKKVAERPINQLRQLAFIERCRTLPDRKDRWYELDWHITPAGYAWLAANQCK
jgi:hypothetical protein